jgi:hypothetical protein
MFCVSDTRYTAPRQTDTVQVRNTKKSSGTFLSNRRRYTSCKTHSPTSGYHYLAHHGTTANMARASTVSMG